MSNSTKLITLRRMVRDLLIDVIDNPSSMRKVKSRICGLHNRIGLMIWEEGLRIGDKLAETSNEENRSESGDHPDHLTVVETRRYGTEVRGGDVTVEVRCQNPDSLFPRMERLEADWEQFYTADGMPRPYYNRKQP